MNHLCAFEKVSRRMIEFESIDMKFYYGFVDYLTQVKKLAINTIGKLITNIKVLMREAVEVGYTTNMEFTHRRFRSVSIETDAVYLTETEIIELRKLDLSPCKRLESVRDLFLIGCYTGLRFSDLSQLSIEAVSNNILTLIQVKTGDRVYIPLKNEVQVVRLNLSARPKKSGGKTIGHQKRFTNNTATQAFRLAAQTMWQQKGVLGHLYRRLAHTKGSKKAIKAVARRLAVIFYHMVQRQTAYDPKVIALDEAKLKERKIARLKKEAEKLGCTINLQVA